MEIIPNLNRYQTNSQSSSLAVLAHLAKPERFSEANRVGRLISVSLHLNNKIKQFFVLLTFFISSTVFGQKVFSVEYSSQADVKVFVVKYESQADLKVFKEKYESQAGKNDGKWFFTQYESQAQKKIYFVQYENQADIKIYFVDYESQAGWNNKSKIPFFY